MLLIGSLIALWPRPMRAAPALERIYEGLQELEYDRATHKVSEDDYRRLRRELVRRAGELQGAEEAARAALAREVAVLLSQPPTSGGSPS